MEKCSKTTGILQKLKHRRCLGQRTTSNPKFKEARQLRFHETRSVTRRWPNLENRLEGRMKEVHANSSALHAGGFASMVPNVQNLRWGIVTNAPF